MDCTHCGEPLEGAIVDAAASTDSVEIIVECEWCGERWVADVFFDNMERIGPLDDYRPVQVEDGEIGCWTEDDEPCPEQI